MNFQQKLEDLALGGDKGEIEVGNWIHILLNIGEKGIGRRGGGRQRIGLGILLTIFYAVIPFIF